MSTKQAEDAGELMGVSEKPDLPLFEQLTASDDGRSKMRPRFDVSASRRESTASVATTRTLYDMVTRKKALEKEQREKRRMLHVFELLAVSASEKLQSTMNLATSVLIQRAMKTGKELPTLEADGGGGDESVSGKPLYRRDEFNAYRILNIQPDFPTAASVDLFSGDTLLFTPPIMSALDQSSTNTTNSDDALTSRPSFQRKDTCLAMFGPRIPSIAPQGSVSCFAKAEDLTAMIARMRDMDWSTMPLDESTERTAWALLVISDSELLGRHNEGLCKIWREIQMECMDEDGAIEETMLSAVVRAIALETVVAAHMLRHYPIFNLNTTDKELEEVLSQQHGEGKWVEIFKPEPRISRIRLTQMSTANALESQVSAFTTLFMDDDLETVAVDDDAEDSVHTLSRVPLADETQVTTSVELARLDAEEKDGDAYMDADTEEIISRPSLVRNNSAPRPIQNLRHLRCGGCGHSFDQIDQPTLVSCGNNRLMFHDEMCVALRRYKEAIRIYVIHEHLDESEKDKARSSVEDEILLLYKHSNMLIFCENDQVVRPTDRGEMLEEDDSDDEKGSHKPQISTLVEDLEQTQCKFGNVANLRWRKVCALELYTWLHAEADDSADDVFNARRNALPKIFHYFDPVIHGPSVFEFIVKTLSVREDDNLWTFFNNLMAVFPTAIALRLIKKHELYFRRFQVAKIDHFLESIILTSDFPAAVSLYVAGLVSEFCTLSDVSRNDKVLIVQQKYVSAAKTLLKEVENPHLIGFICLLPSKIDDLTLLDIALKFHLSDFASFHLLVPVIARIWETPDVLNPSKEYPQRDRSWAQSLEYLWKSPGKYYFSAEGTWKVSSLAYVMYLFFISFVSYLKIYPYEPWRKIEYLLWFSNLGFGGYELIQVFLERGAYFDDMLNFFDVGIVMNWLALFALRLTILKDASSTNDSFTHENSEDSVKWRNRTLPILYQILWGAQVVIFWCRGTMVVQRPSRLYALTKVMRKLVTDIKSFTVILVLLSIGFFLCVHYMVSDDFDRECHHEPGQEAEKDGNLWLHGIFNIVLYMYQTLLGQQEWSETSHKISHCIGFTRERALRVVVVVYSLICTILLLNLLIGIMASTYDAMKKVEVRELNFARVKNTLKTHQNFSLLPSPFNMLSMVTAVVWYASKTVVHLFLFGKWTLRCWVLFPFEVAVSEMRSESTGKSEKAYKWTDVICSTKHLSQKSLACGFCRYCRRPVLDENGKCGDVTKFTKLLSRGRKLDDDDIDYVHRLCDGQTLCANCYRPFIEREVLSEWQVTAEVTDYAVFWCVVRPILLLVYALPASIHWLLAKASRCATEDIRKPKGIVFTNEYKISDCVRGRRAIAVESFANFERLTKNEALFGYKQE